MVYADEIGQIKKKIWLEQSVLVSGKYLGSCQTAWSKRRDIKWNKCFESNPRLSGLRHPPGQTQVKQSIQKPMPKVDIHSIEIRSICVLTNNTVFLSLCHAQACFFHSFCQIMNNLCGASMLHPQDPRFFMYEKCTTPIINHFPSHIIETEFEIVACHSLHLYCHLTVNQVACSKFIKNTSLTLNE